MVSLKSVTDRFEITFNLIEGGSGFVRGVLAEAEQNSQPSYVFSPPRLTLRVKTKGLLQPGVTIQSPDGLVYLVGYNGPSENHTGHLWDSFRLFRATGQVPWSRRETTTDLVTGLPKDSGIVELGMVWSVIEQIDRETLDRKIHSSVEQARYITSARIREDDILDGRQVTRADLQLGLMVGTLT